MLTSPFHIYYKARELAGYVDGENKLIPAFASSNIHIYPYQIAAALFALRSPFLKGVILADEGSLGKTYEALLVASQRWYEGRNKQLLILPASLVRQWIEKLDGGFTLPYVLIDTEEAFSTQPDTNNPFEQEALAITTYDFAVEKAEYIKRITWDLVILDEADRLSKSHTGDNKTASILKSATEDAFRLLLTPTPITMSIMDIYGLLHFIDETILPDEKEFYERYFRKPENYGELAEWVSLYSFRTLKSQVTHYVNFTRRIPYTVGYELTSDEKSLYRKIEQYLALPRKAAYPRMDRYDLTLMFYHIVSSSPQAFCRTLDGVHKRMSDRLIPYEKGEKELLHEAREIAGSIAISGKMKSLLSILKMSFARLGEIKAGKKTIIFTDNLVTQKTLCELLRSKGYKGVLTYSGSNSRDYDIMEQFRSDRNIQILIATDEAAKGLDIEFCPVVVNYDLLYNAVELEQRITRCHRQGQQSDVLVVNLLGKENFSDVRIMELINKRVLQFDGIFGMSDDILGNFDADIDVILGQLRHHDTIQQQFQENLNVHKPENQQLVEHVENRLFTTFTKEVADKITLTPEYIEDKIAAINSELWEVVKWYFEDYNRHSASLCRYIINDQARTITADSDLGHLPELFYYWVGSRNRPYRSLLQYGMASDFSPRYGRITLTSILGRNILDEVHCESIGTLTVDADIEPCEIGFYAVYISPKGQSDDKPYYSFLGQTTSGKTLSDRECRRIMELPVHSYTEEKTGEYVRKNYNSRIFTSQTELNPRQIDTLLPTDDFIQRRLQEKDSAQAGQIGVMKHKTAIAKTRLEREADALAGQIKAAEQSLADAPDRISRIQADKKLKVLQAELRRKQDDLFMDRMRLDLQLEQDIEAFIAGQQLTARVQRHYLIEVRGVISG